MGLWDTLTELSKAPDVSKVIQKINDKKAKLSAVTVMSTMLSDVDRGEFNSPTHAKPNAFAF